MSSEEHFPPPAGLSSCAPSLTKPPGPSMWPGSPPPATHCHLTQFSFHRSAWYDLESRMALVTCLINFLWSPVNVNTVTAETLAWASRTVSDT